MAQMVQCEDLVQVTKILWWSIWNQGMEKCYKWWSKDDRYEHNMETCRKAREEK